MHGHSNIKSKAIPVLSLRAFVAYDRVKPAYKDSSMVLALFISTCDKLFGNVETSDFRTATLAQHFEDPVV